jgi:hypothetical protein
MATRDEAFPSKFLKAADIKGRSVTVTVDKVVKEEVGDSEKFVCYFKKADKGLVLNGTSWDALEDISGELDSDNWHGVRVTLTTIKVRVKGETKDSIIVQPVNETRGDPQAPLDKPAKVAPPAQAAVGEGLGKELDDEIPF